MQSWSLPHKPLTLSQKKNLEGFFKKIDQLLTQATPIQAEHGQALFYKGHKPLGVVVVVSGQVRLKETRSHWSFLPKHYPIGLDWVLFNQDYPLTAEAVGDVEYYFLSKNEIFNTYDFSDGI